MHGFQVPIAPRTRWEEALDELSKWVQEVIVLIKSRCCYRVDFVHMRNVYACANVNVCDKVNIKLMVMQTHYDAENGSGGLIIYKSSFVSI